MVVGETIRTSQQSIMVVTLLYSYVQLGTFMLNKTSCFVEMQALDKKLVF